MPEKSRTPRPPRPVQAPRVRTDPRKPRDPRRTRLLIAAVAGVALLAAAIGGIAYATSRGGSGAEAGGICEVSTYESQGQQHVPPGELPDDFEYNSYPPTTGPHHPQPALFGEYPNPVPIENYLHSMEHGGVVIQYGADVPDDVVQRLVNWYRVDPRGLIVAPLPDDEEAAELSDKIAMGAWVAEREVEDDPGSRIAKQEGKLAICATFDEGAFDAFRDDYLARGPELFSLDDLMPGQG